MEKEVPRIQCWLVAILSLFFCFSVFSGEMETKEEGLAENSIPIFILGGEESVVGKMLFELPYELAQLFEDSCPNQLVITRHLGKRWRESSQAIRHQISQFNKRLNFGLVVVCDREARAFFERYGKELFPKCFWIVYGSDDYGWPSEMRAKTVFLERKKDAYPLVRFALKLHTNRKRFVFIHGASARAEHEARAAAAAIRKSGLSERDFPIRFLSGKKLTCIELLARSQHIASDEIVVLFDWEFDCLGEVPNGREFVTRFCNAVPAPVYVFDEIFYGCGAVAVFSPEISMVARRLMLMACRVNASGAVEDSDLGYSELILRHHCDIPVLKHWRISAGQLPDSVIFFDEDEEFSWEFEEWYERIGTFVLVFSFVLFMLLILLFMHQARTKRRLWKKMVLQQGMDSVGEGVYFLDGKFRVTYWNAEMARLTGIAVDEVEKGRPVWDWIPEVAEEGIDLSIREAMTGKDSSSFLAATWPAKDGPQGTCTEHDYRPLYSEYGEVLGVIGLVRDVTEKKQAELASRRREKISKLIQESASFLLSCQEERLEREINSQLRDLSLILNAQGASICLLDREKGMLYETNEWISKGNSSVLNFDNSRDVSSYLMSLEALTSRRLIAVSCKGETVDESMDESVRLVRGLMRESAYSMQNWIPLTSCDSLWGFLVFGYVEENHDVGDWETTLLLAFGKILASAFERTKLNSALRRNALQLREIFDQMNIGCLVVDPLTGEILRTNRTLEEITGFSDKVLREKRCHNLLCPNGCDGAHCALLTASDDSERKRFIKCFEGERLPILATGTPLLLDGRDTVLITVVDLSQQMSAAAGGAGQAELMEQMGCRRRMELLTKLLAGVGHNFNNAVSAILASAEYLEDRLPDASPLREELRDIANISGDVGKLTHQIADCVSQLRMPEEHVVVSDYIKEIQDVLHQSVDPRLHLELDLAKGRSECRLEPVQLQYLLKFLLANAAAAIGEKDGRIRISMGRAVYPSESLSDMCLASPPEEGQYAFIKIEDDGDPISAEDLECFLASPYSARCIEREFGLVAALGIARLVGGTVAVKTGLEKGNAFQVLLPVAHGESSFQEDTSVGAPPSILVVDDEESILDFERNILGPLGMEILCARDGVEAISLFRRKYNSIVLIILDVSLPRMEGDHVLSVIRKFGGEMPVIVVSAHGRHDLTRRFVNYENVELLTKPYDPSEFLDLAKKLIGVGDGE